MYKILDSPDVRRNVRERGLAEDEVSAVLHASPRWKNQARLPIVAKLLLADLDQLGYQIPN
jgi:hypothetical protein